MSHWENLRIHSLRKNKAQSLTELATFGSVFLLVLSFFISYGMRHLYQQDINMRAFRMALADAYNTDSRYSNSLILVKDKHIPDPRDTFGVGEVQPILGQGNVVWANSLQDKYKGLSDLPRIKFVINKGTHEYTTADYVTITPANPQYSVGFYVQLSDKDPRAFITWDRVRAFKPEGAVEPQAMVLDDVTKETEIISEVAASRTTPMKEIINVLPIGLSHGDPVTGFFVLDRQAGQINPAYFGLNTDLNDDGNYDGEPDVTPYNLQGYLSPDIRVVRGDTLSLEERSGSGYYKSVNNITTNVEVTHKIGKNKFNEEGEPVGRDIDPFTERREIKGVSKTWETRK